MPRNGSNIYSIPPGTEGFPDTTIESEKYNNYIHDVETDLNTPRPISAGGTGANDADEALANLGAEKSSQEVVNYDTHVFYPGSFYSKTTATGEAVNDHAFVGIAVSSDAPTTPPANQNVVLHARDQTDVVKPGRLWVREKKDGVWGAWALDGGGLASPAPPVSPPDGTLWWDNISGQLYIFYRDVDTAQWVIASPTPSPEDFLLKSGDTMEGTLGLFAPPTADLHAANKKYVDDKIATDATAIANAKVAKAGDTMTGPLTMQQSNIVGQTTGGVARWTIVPGDGSGNFSVYSHNDAGAATGTPMSINRSNNVTTFGNTVVIASGSINAPGGLFISPPSAGLFTIGTNTFVGFGPNNYIQYNAAAPSFNFASGGAGWGSIGSSWLPTNDLIAGGGVGAGGNPNFGLIRGGGVEYLSFAHSSGYFFSWSESDGNLYCYQANNLQTYWRAADGTFHATNGNAGKPGGGFWADDSDIRIKNIDGEYTRGLDAVCALKPVHYSFKGNETYGAPEAAFKPLERDENGKEIPREKEAAPTQAPYPNSPHYQAAKDNKKFVGLVAQEVESVFPEMITRQNAQIDGKPVADLLNINATSLIYALVNSCKELKARVEALEAQNASTA